MKKHFSLLFWRAFSQLLRKAQWVAIVLLMLAAYFAVALTDGVSEAWHAGALSKDVTLRLAGSLLSSAVFLFLVQVVTAIRDAPTSAESTYFKAMHDQFGIREAFEHRGEPAALDRYRKALQRASRRIWAIGMTNRRFVSSHADAVHQALRRSSEMDVKLIFTDEALVLSWDEVSINAIELQTQLEDKAPGAGSPKYLSSFVQKFKDAHGSSDVGHLQILKLRSSCQFTCFVIDDDVFFFPMLARHGSAQDPTILVDARGVLGGALLHHFESLFRSAIACACIYDNRAQA